MRLFTLYLVMVCVGTTTIMIGVGADFITAIGTAAVGAISKTLAAFAHEICWEYFYKEKKAVQKENKCVVHRNIGEEVYF